MPDKYVYRPRTNWAYLALVLVICGLAAGSFYAAGMVYEGNIAVINSLAAVVIFWVLIVHPKVVFTNTGIEIHNPFRTVKIGWLTADDFVTKYSFTVLVKESKFSAWAAPAANRFITRRFHNTDYRGTGLETRKVIAPSDSPKSESGVALILANKQSQDAIQKGTASDHLIKQLNWLTIVASLSSVAVLLFTLSQ
jgi:hypothetical protein